jgi:hypothetical protein
MQDTANIGTAGITEDEAKAEADRLQAEIRRLREGMQRDQDEIDYLKAKTN